MAAIVKGPLQQLDTAFIELALAQDEQQFYAQFSTYPGTDVSTDPSVYWMIGGDGLGLWSSVYRTRFEPADVDRQITAVLARFLARGVPRMFWTVAPGDQPSDLGMRLVVHHGLEYVRQEGMMAVNLDALPAIDQARGGLQINVVATEAALREWVHLAGFAFPSQLQDEARIVNLNWYRHVVLKKQGPLQLFVGRVDGQPVGACALFTGAGLASIHDVNTHPEWRRRGIGTAMTSAALASGRSQGMQIGGLTSEQPDPSLYVGLGFQQFGALHRYRWTRKPALGRS
jgi:ribosomal protein S18 acetylase RimI-like enzyme